MRVCVVGNGQSPMGHGDFIDCHDFVVRVNAWWLTHKPPLAGRRIDAWVWNLAGYILGETDPGKKDKPVKVPPPAGNYEIWHGWRYASGGRTARANALAWRKLGKRKVRPLDKARDSRLSSYLKKLCRPGKAVPTAGLRAIDHAIAFLGPKIHHLTVIGFDAVTPDRPGWNDKGNPWTKHWSMHGFIAEKRLLAELTDNRLWLGAPMDFTVNWTGRPEEIP